MSHFTEEQIKELETIFGIQRKAETLPVRDGVVTKDTMVWWCGNTELEHVKAGEDWGNIASNPDIYQLEKPVVKKIVYA